MNNDLYIAFAEDFPHANFIFDLQKNTFIYLNKAFVNLFNVTANIINIDTLLAKVPAEDHKLLRERFQKLKEGVTSASDTDFRINLENNTEKWIRVTFHYSNDQAGRELLFGMARDITSELTNLRTYLKYSNKKNSILNIIAHDLRGPLSVAQMANSLLGNKLIDPDLKYFTDMISRTLKQSIHLISDLMQREFLETADVVLIKKRINITARMKEVMEEYQHSAELTRRTFLFDCPSENIFLDIDESKFIQIINNLMSNALKFTREDGIIRMSIEDKQHAVLFSVSDNGIGIPKEFQPTLFDEFTEAGREGLQGEPSMGLGMYVIKTIVEWHNGQVWVESEENKGTTVFFKIPKA